MFLTGATASFQKENVACGSRRQEAKKGPQPAHYSAGKLIAKDSGSVVIPMSRATVQTVCITQGNALASLTQKNPCGVCGERGQWTGKAGRPLDAVRTFLHPGTFLTSSLCLSVQSIKPLAWFPPG